MDARPERTEARDRDERGRARNARPRDATGRPLPKGAAGVERIPDDLALPPEEALAEAQRLLDAGLPFQAHEVLEGTWKATTGNDRPFWQGLAQLAVGLTHARRGNATGAAALLERGAERIAPFRAESPHGVDVAGLCQSARELAERIRTEGLASVTDAELRPRLSGERVRRDS